MSNLHLLNFYHLSTSPHKVIFVDIIVCVYANATICIVNLRADTCNNSDIKEDEMIPSCYDACRINNQDVKSN